VRWEIIVAFQSLNPPSVKALRSSCFGSKGREGGREGRVGEQGVREYFGEGGREGGRERGNGRTSSSGARSKRPSVISSSSCRATSSGASPVKGNNRDEEKQVSHLPFLPFLPPFFPPSLLPSVPTCGQLGHRRLPPRPQLLDEGIAGLSLEVEGLLLVVELLEAEGGREGGHKCIR